MNTKINKLMLIIGLSILFFSRPAYAEKIMAIVNNDVITESELEGFIQFTKLDFASKYQGEELEEKTGQLRKDALKRLIENKIILQESKKLKIEVNKKLINRRVADIRSKYPSEEVFQQSLFERGLTLADIEKRIREQMLISQFIEDKFRNSIIISPTEIPKFYNANPEMVDEPERRRVFALIIPDKELLQKALDALKDDNDFAKIADKFQVRLVDLGLVAKGELRKEFDWAVFLLATTGVCPYVEADQEYYILKVNEIIPAKKLSLEETQARIKELIFSEKVNKKIIEWLDNAKAKSYIVIKE